MPSLETAFSKGHRNLLLEFVLSFFQFFAYWPESVPKAQRESRLFGRRRTIRILPISGYSPFLALSGSGKDREGRSIPQGLMEPLAVVEVEIGGKTRDCQRDALVIF